jgi:hypothetical protein
MDTARALTANLADLLRREHAALGEFLVALAEFDQRRLWVDLGHASPFYFLHRELHLSKAAAQYRKVAAELIQQVPAIVEPLRDGRLCLTSIIEAAKVVTVENWEAVLPRFFGLSRREAMEVVAELQPHPAPPTRTVVTSRTAPPLPAREASARASLLPEGPVPHATEAATGSPDELTVSETAVLPAAAPRPAEVVPLSAHQSRLHVTVSDRFLRKLEAATDSLSHSHPGASPEAILEAGLDLLLAQAEKRRGFVDKPQKTPRPATPDHVPAHVKRAVWARDGGRCQYPLASGDVCGRKRHLQLDHIKPLALGGTSTIDNMRVACRMHNLLSARLAFGDELMDRYASDPRGPRPMSQPRPPSSA